MKEVFADSGYWIALLDEDDTLHTAATMATNVVRTTRVVTTTAVLTEVMAHFCNGGVTYRRGVATFVEGLMVDRDRLVIHAGIGLYMDALAMYRDYDDKQWSHVDCISFQIMQRRGITDALSHDNHFRQAGFTTLF